MDSLTIAGKAYASRLLIGTGKYKDFDETRRAVEASGAQIVTVAIRRTNIGQNANEPSLLDALPPSRYTYLPNTAGCYSADDAVRTLRLARELLDGHDLDYVVPGSVVVRDYTGATLVEGTHYTLTPFGTKTLVRRLITPINDQDRTFSVDYAYETGGSAVYSILDQHVQASLTLYRYYNIYVRYRDSAQTLISGAPTLPLNSVRNTSYGARADTPLPSGILVGGEVTYEYDREDISPYDRRDYLAYLQFPLPFLSTLRLSGRRTEVDYLYASQRVELTGYIAQLNSRPWYRTLLTAEASYDEDTGGSLLRQTWSRALMAEWQIRQMTLRAEGRYTSEALGDAERDRTMVRMLLRRDFR